MELYQDLKIKLNSNYLGFQKTLIELVNHSNGWQVKEDMQEAFKKNGLLRDREVICIETPVLSYKGRELKAVIWTYDYGYMLQTFNIIPTNTNRLSKEEYNFILNVFVDTFIRRTAADYHSEVVLSNPLLDLNDYVDKEVVHTLKLFSEMANKSTGRTHPLDEKRWFDFLIISSSRKCRLSVDYLEGWLVDNGWSPDMASSLGLDYEYGLSLLDYEHNRR